MKSIRTWLGLDAAPAPADTPLRHLIDTLDRLEPARARHLARFAYLLGRIAHADRHITPEETQTMEALVVTEGGLQPDQAVVVVGLAKTSNTLFGGTADFLVAQEFADAASYDEKLALARCLFAVAATDETISMAEEAEIHRITNQLRVLPHDLVEMRVQHRRFLPGLAPPAKPPAP